MTKNAITAVVGSLCALVLCQPHSFGQSLSGSSLEVTGTSTLNALVATTGTVGVLTSGTATLDVIAVTGLATLQGGLSVSGTADFRGNNLYFGSWVSDPEHPGVSLLYTDAASESVPSRLTFLATKASHEWLWEHDTADHAATVPTMKLDANHVLTLYNTAGTAAIVLDPSSPSSPTAVLTQQAADSRYVSSANFMVTTGTSEWYGEGPTISLTGGTATGIYTFAMNSATASGDYSTASGYCSTASGVGSTASGWGSTASGDFSIASGWGSTASGYGSTASGYGSTASGEASIASGEGSIASGWYSTASGYGSTASWEFSTASGAWATASGYGSTASGEFSTASGWVSISSGDYSTASGSYSISSGLYSTASGEFSTAAGAYTTAGSYGQFVIGQHNILQGDPSQWVPTDELFTIGNGVDSSHLSNAFVVKKNGDTTVYGKLTVSATNGSTAATPSGFSIAYDDGTDGVNSAITLQSTRPSSTWNWQRLTASGTAANVMQIDDSNRLILTGTAATNPPQLVLDPNGSVALNGSNLLTQTDADARYFSSSAGLSASNGNIGIGTTTPSSLLNVTGVTTLQSGDATSGALKIGADVLATTLSTNVRKLGRITTPSYNNLYNFAVLSADSPNASTDFVAFGGSPGAFAPSPTYISFATTTTVGDAAGNTERMRIASNGNVGIGTTTPSAKLHVLGTTEQLRFGYDTSSYWNATTGSTGIATFSATGASASFSFANTVKVINSNPFLQLENPTANSSTAGTLQFRAGGGAEIFSQSLNASANVFSMSYGSTLGIAINSSGNVGIGTSSPSAKLDVNGSAKVSQNLAISGTGSLTLPDGTVLSASNTLISVITSGTAGPSSVLTQQAADSRYVSSVNLTVNPDYSYELRGGDATGVSSFAGINATASGFRSMASGIFSTASGYGSIASGYVSDASGYESAAIGNFSTASGDHSIASGYYSTASGSASIASGYWAIASGSRSIATGYSSFAGGHSSTASGFGSNASGTASTASGYWSNASGNYATAAGVLTQAAGSSQFVVGQYNIPQGDSSSWVPTDELFIVGNGQHGYFVDGNSPDYRSNAFTVKKNGDTTVYGKLTVSANNGSTVATPSGVSIAYDDGADGVNSIITLQSTRPSSTWNWNRMSTSGSATNVMQLDASNRLILTGTVAENPPQLILDPNVASGPASVLTQQAADSRYVINGESSGGSTVLGNTTINGTASVTEGLIVTGTTATTLNNTTVNGDTKLTGALIVTGTMDSAINTVVATGTNQLVLIPQQGDLSMGDFTNGAKPQ